MRIFKEPSTNTSIPYNFTVFDKDTIAYIVRKIVKDKIIFPRSSAERLELKVYPRRAAEYMKVWNTTITVTFNLPQDVVQGVYRVPNTVSYYFKVSPGLLVYLKLHSPANESFDDLKILVTIRLSINGEELVPNPSDPRMKFFIDCITLPHDEWFWFDIIYMGLHRMLKGNLEMEGLKPLLKLKGTINVKYIVEVYVEKPLLDKEFSLEISVGPPYIVEHFPPPDSQPSNEHSIFRSYERFLSLNTQY